MFRSVDSVNVSSLKKTSFLYVWACFLGNVRQNTFLFCFLIKEVCLKSELKQTKTIHLRFYYLTKLLSFFVSLFVFSPPCSPFYLNIGFNKEKDALKICCRKKYTKQGHFLNYSHHKEKGSSRSCGITGHHMSHNCSSCPTEDGTGEG